MTAAPPAVQPSFQLPSLGQATTPAVTPTVAKPPVQKGKLKMNLSPNQPKSGPTKGKAGLKTGLVTKLSTSEGKLANDSLFNSKDEDTAAPVKEKQEDQGTLFECNICLDTASQPVVTLCGHLFCWPWYVCSRWLSLTDC